MFPPLLRLPALLAALALSWGLAACSNARYRELSEAEAGLFLKHVQLWVMAPQGGRASILKPAKGSSVDASLAVPVTRDGYLLATSHGVPRGKVALTLLDGENRPVYVATLDGKGPAEFQVVTSLRPLEGWRMNQPPPGTRERRLRVVQRFPSSDLVLLKAPFATPRHVEVLSSVPMPREPVYFPSNPLLGEQGTLVLCPLDYIQITSANTWFVSVEHIASQGYSGTPMMNHEGRLIALGVKSSLSREHPVLWGSGISKEVLDETIARDRRRQGG